jgi:hypothetical protein
MSWPLVWRYLELDKLYTRSLSAHVASKGQSEPAPMTAPVGRSVHRMGWMTRLFFIHLFTLR